MASLSEVAVATSGKGGGSFSRWGLDCRYIPATEAGSGVPWAQVEAFSINSCDSSVGMLGLGPGTSAFQAEP